MSDKKVRCPLTGRLAEHLWGGAKIEYIGRSNFCNRGVFSGVALVSSAAYSV